MTKRTPKPRTVTAGELPRITSRVLEDAKSGKRTAITHYNVVVAGVVSANDLKQLEEAK